MTVWERYDKDQRNSYEEYLKMYGALSALFNQKASKTGAPYLDPKFQETIYARCFDSEEQLQLENEKAKIKRIYQFVDASLHFQYWRDNIDDPMKINLLRDLFAMLMFYEANSLDGNVDSIAEIAFDNLLTENPTQDDFVNYGMSLLEQSEEQKVRDNLLFTEFIANGNSVGAMLPYKDRVIVFLKELYELITINPFKGGN